MITLNLEWREVLWWMQGGMAGSHLCWSVYEDMVNMVWPQCSEQERRNVWIVMRRDLGLCWRKHWQGVDLGKAGEGEWRDDITDKTPWMHFRQVLARFDPENQYAVMLPIKDESELLLVARGLNKESIIDAPTCYTNGNGDSLFDVKSHSFITVRAYRWRYMSKDAFFVDWSHRVDPDQVIKAEKLDIPDDGTM